MSGLKTKRLMKFMVSAIMAQMIVVASAFATASTHIWAPSTDVQAYKKWHLTADFYVPTESNSDGSRANTITNAGLTVGILPFKKLNAEVGFDHKSGYGSLDKYPIYFNAKVGIPEDSYGKFFPAVAFGIYDIGTKEDKTDSNVFYGKIAKTLTLGGVNLGRLSAGYFVGNKKLLLHGSKRDNEGVLLAWERVMSEISDKLWVAVEYQGSRSSYGAMNYGFSWKFADNVSVIFGYQVYNDVDLANTFTIQTDIDF
jgi:hypothetical protein